MVVFEIVFLINNSADKDLKSNVKVGKIFSINHIQIEYEVILRNLSVIFCLFAKIVTQ